LRIIDAELREFGGRLGGEAAGPGRWKERSGLLLTLGDAECPLRSDDQIWRVEGRNGIHLVDSGAGIERLIAAEKRLTRNPSEKIK